jgi:hypothetical protein
MEIISIENMELVQLLPLIPIDSKITLIDFNITLALVDKSQVKVLV